MGLSDFYVNFSDYDSVLENFDTKHNDKDTDETQIAATSTNIATTMGVAVFLQFKLI